MKQNRIEKYLDAVVGVLRHTAAPEEYWPLRPPQLTACFEDSLAVDIFKRTQILKERRVPLDEVASLFMTPGTIRNFLLSFGSTGLKLAHNLGWAKTDARQREEFFNYLFDLLEAMIKSDIFVVDKKQIILNQEEIAGLPWGNFIKLDGRTCQIIIKFKLALLNLVWAFFFDAFYYVGRGSHGSYPVPREIIGAGRTLAINEYFNLCPKAIWPAASNIPFEKVRVYNVYKDLVWQIDFFEREDPQLNLGRHLDLALVKIDGRIIQDLDELDELTRSIFKIIEKQTNFVNDLKPLGQVKKAAEISYFGLCKIFDYFKDDWRPPKEVYEIIERMGEELIKKFTSWSPLQGTEAYRIFDPRNNYLGE